jgi:hypothetical protein
MLHVIFSKKLQTGGVTERRGDGENVKIWKCENEKISDLMEPKGGSEIDKCQATTSAIAYC